MMTRTVLKQLVSLDSLEQALFDDEAYVRQKVVVAIGNINDPSTAPILVSTLHDQRQDRFARQQAILALGRLKATEYIADIVRLANDPSEYVRAAVAWALGQMQDTDVKLSLIELLQDKASHLIRVNAAEALGKLGQADRIVTDALKAATRDKVDFVRKGAIDALARLDQTNLTDFLTGVNTPDISMYVRGRIEKVLPEYPKKDRVRLMPAFLRKTSYQVAVRQLDGGNVVDVLKQALMDPRESKREAARKALGFQTVHSGNN
ncbi:MAG: HEAT repeat domain-containing protein [Chloroflexota bacterium]|nr:HEAT repeat domain-containing protein [Chloroflexota bacterium]